MAARTYGAWSGAQPTTAPMGKVALLANTTKTVLQVQASSSVGLRVIEWGVSFDAALTSPAEVELLDTAAVAATVTAFGSGDVVKMNGPNDAAATVTLGVAASGFGASSEGTITTGRLGDYQLVAQAFAKQMPLGREFELPVSHNLRIRVTAPAGVNCIGYVVWEE